MAEVRSHLERANIDRLRVEVAALAKAIGTKNRRGVGDVKREEVRFLILSGLPHAEVIRRAGVSSGTMSAIREEMGQAIALHRNSESLFACRDEIDSSLDDSQAVENIGGPGRTRTCDLTVMSGLFQRGKPRKI